MRKKKLPNGQEYLRVAQEWIADPFLCAKAIDYSKIGWEDQSVFIANEIENEKLKRPLIDSEVFHFDKVVIVSDGFDFKKSHELLSQLSNNVAILCINGALAGWKLVGESCPYEKRKAIDYYVINNPYEESMSFFPKNHRYFCKCICSVRTNPDFIKGYVANRGDVFFYCPSRNQRFAGLNWKSKWTITDYRNPIAAAIEIAARGGASQITLFSCDDSYETKLPGMVEIRPSYYAYPHHIHVGNVLDGISSILSKYDIQVNDYSKGISYQSINNINEKEFLEIN